MEYQKGMIFEGVYASVHCRFEIIEIDEYSLNTYYKLLILSAVNRATGKSDLDAIGVSLIRNKDDMDNNFKTFHYKPIKLKDTPKADLSVLIDMALDKGDKEWLLELSKSMRALQCQ